ncbi:MAG: hypothetical protein M0R03_17955 [Novosphingobium sp.]|nr:hypothetical protein [Novosphingobium sp.]
MAQQFFHINKNSLLPHLICDLIDDGRHDCNKFYDNIQNARIFFNMTDIETGVTYIAHQPASIFLREDTECVEKYSIGYVWKNNETRRPGTYRGQFEILFNDDLEGEPNGNLIVPIREELIIQIMEGSIKK